MPLGSILSGRRGWEANKTSDRSLMFLRAFPCKSIISHAKNMAAALSDRNQRQHNDYQL